MKIEIYFFPCKDPFEGGEVAVGSIVAMAKEVCATANTDQPFMCLDLTYIAVLLKDGYGLNMKTNIKVSHTHHIDRISFLYRKHSHEQLQIVVAHF